MAGDWVGPEERAERRGDIAVEQWQAAQDQLAEETAQAMDDKYFHYSDAWYGMEPR